LFYTKNNIHQSLKALGAWGKKQIELPFVATLRRIAKPRLFPKSLQKICLWVDTTEFKKTGTRSICKKSPEWSVKQKGAARKWLFLSDAKSRIVFVDGPYTPTTYDGHILANVRETLEREVEGAGILGDSHFHSTSQFFKKIDLIATKPPIPGRQKMKKKDDSGGLSKDELKLNKEIKKFRGIVEQSYSWFQSKFGALAKPFGEKEKFHHLVLFAIGVHTKMIGQINLNSFFSTYNSIFYFDWAE